MDPRLLRHYNSELGHLREMGAEFSRQFPKIAGRLGIDGVEVTDPYVERLMEGAAFLAARVQLRLDAEFPRFTQRLLEIVYPQYLAPIPAMVMARFEPDLNDANLAAGVVLPRGTALRSLLGKGDATACEFRTGQAVTLLPIEIAQAQYFTYAPDLPLTSLPGGRRIKGGVRIRLRAGAGLKFNQLELERLALYLSGADEIAYRLHELCLSACAGVLCLPAERPAPWQEFLDAAHLLPLGYGDDEALLPVTLRGFQGYRLLQEYHAFPQRFLFVELDGLARAARRCDGDELDVVLLFSAGDAALESVVDTAQFSLFCAPAINLFPKRTDRIHLNPAAHDYHVVVDRSRPMDFEIHDLQSVTGFGEGSEHERRFLPFYAACHGASGDTASDHGAYYSLQREPRLLSTAQQRKGFRSSYVGSEVFLSLVDAEEAPFSETLKQLSITALCTNRDLPLHMPVGAGRTDFTLEAAAPVTAVRCVRGPTRPHSALREGASPWRFISHLSLNYLSLLERDAIAGAAALRELLTLYAQAGDPALAKQIDGVRAVKVSPLVRRLPMPGPITFGRGLRIELDVDELAFQGASAFLFGSVMERFLTRYVSINSFTETVLRGSARGEIMRWVPRCGQRAVL
jgi:type VI secretion system protein ImpG